MNDEQQESAAPLDPWRSVPEVPEGKLARAQDPASGAAAAEPEDTPSGNQLAFEFVRQLAADLSSDALDLPSLPGIVMRIKSVLEDDDSTVDTISRVVGSEPALAARLLAMANSAAFGRGGIEVTDLKTAVGRLGRDLIRTSAMSFAMQNLMDAQSVAQLKPNLTALWKHSITVAAMAHTIGKRVEGVNADQAMFIGLIHDIGKLYILSRIGRYPELFKCSEVVDQIMADWHAQIGKAIVDSWELPEQVAEVVAQHGEIEREKFGKPDMLDVLIGANLLAKALDGGGVEELDFENVTAFKRLGIEASSVAGFAEESEKEVDSLMSALRG